MGNYEINYERFKELKKTYKIARSSKHMVEGSYVPIPKDNDYDVIVECVGTGYAHKKYRVIKNTPGLSYRDLAIICDAGNLCFGYRMEGGVICVHTD